MPIIEKMCKFVDNKRKNRLYSYDLLRYIFFINNQMATFFHIQSSAMKHIARCVLLLIALATMLPSCRHAVSQSSEDSLHRSQIDSILSTQNDMESLLRMRQDYRKAGDVVGEMLTLKRMGVVYREQNKFIEAIDVHTAGFDIANSINDTLEMIQNLNNIGTNYRRMSMLHDASTFHYKALTLCDKYSDTTSIVNRKNKVVSLNGIGNISLRLDDYATADSVFRIALKGERELGSALGQAINYANIGSIFERNEQLDSAWVYYRNSLKMNLIAKSNLGIALCHGYFGNLYRKQGNTAMAYDEYRKAYEMEGLIDKWHWLNSCLSLAEIHIENHEYAEATNLLNRAESVAIDGHSRDRLAAIYRLKYRLYDTLGNPAMALKCYERCHSISDSITSDKNLLEIQNQRIQYEHHARQAELNAIKGDMAKERNTRNFIIVALCALMGFLAVIIILLNIARRASRKEQESLKELERMRTSFFTNISHEFRTPLTAIIGIGNEIMKGNAAETDLPEMGSIITRQGNSLLNLINQILDIAKLQSKNVVLRYQHGNVAGYLHTLVDSARDLARSKSINITFNVSHNDIEMDFVPDYLNKIFNNLVSNALKFVEPNGRIHIIAETKGSELVFSVIDNGKGISPDDLPHIFDLFYTSNTRNSGATSSGVGLSLTHNLVEAMNGSIEATNNPDGGARFVVRLPLVQGDGNWEALGDDVAAEAIVNDIEKPAILQTDDIDNRPVVLITEDNDDILYYTGSVLRNFNIHYAHNGIEAMDIALAIMPDIIITDIMMPERNGLELCKDIRNSSIVSHIPIIVISAKSTQNDRNEAFKAGANAYLTKPFDSEELNNIINSILATQKATQDKFVRNFSNHTDNTITEMSDSDRQFITKVTDIIHTQMEHNCVNVNNIASALGVSHRQLNRKVSALTGENISRYVLLVRMTHAKRLLDSDKDYTIAEVAIRCGFGETSNFTRSFKAIYNITPSQYRKRPAE